jgi:hypothetical protein
MSIYAQRLTIQICSTSIVYMDTRTRPKRRRRVVVEPHDSYTFYLPVAIMERFREATEAAGRSYSDAMLDAVRIYLAANIQIPTMDNGTHRGETSVAD